MEPKTKFEKLREQIPQEKMEIWIQMELKQKIKEFDDFDWSLKLNEPNTLKYIGGMDISFSTKVPDLACSYLIVLTYPDLKSVYEDSEFVQLTEPYVPGFLAFREAPHLMSLLTKLINSKPEFKPQVVLIDGNGILHNNGCGLASHLSVISDIPMIGASKTVFYIDGITKQNLKDDYFVDIVGNSGRVWGTAIKATEESSDPMIISVGSKISLKTALELIKQVCIYRVPEPIRLADKASRNLIKNYENKNFKKEKKEKKDNSLKYL